MAWHFLNIRTAHAEIARLAKQAALFGHPQNEYHGLHIGKANTEIKRLRLIIETAQAAASIPLASAHVQKMPICPPVAGRPRADAEISPAPQTPPPELPLVISRAALNQIAALFPAIEADAGMADGDLLALVEQAAYQAHLRFVGMRSDANLAAHYNRMDAAQAIHGIARTFRAMRQSRIDSICEIASGASQVPGQTQLAAPLRGSPDPARLAPVLPNVTAAGRPSPAQLKQIAVALDVDTPAGMTDAEMFTALEEACFKQHLALPGSRSEAVLSAQFRRAEAAKVIGTTGAVLHTMRQQKINRILSPK